MKITIIEQHINNGFKVKWESGRIENLIEFMCQIKG